MTKTQLLKMFNGSKPEAAKALGVTRQTIYGWSEDLSPEAMIRVRNWFLETQGFVPPKWMPKPKAR